MKKIFFTSGIILKEIIRDKFFYLMSLGGIIFFLLTLIFNEMVVGEPAKVTKDLTLSSVSLFNFIFLLIYGTRIISKEIETKSIYTILIRPFKRWEYLFSNFIALFVSTFILDIFLSFLGIITIKLFYGEFWSSPILKHLFFSSLETIVLISFVLLFSAVFSSSLSLILFFLIYFIGHSLDESLKSIASGNGVAVKPIVNIIKFIIPNLAFFDYKTQLLYGLSFPGKIYIYTILYSFSYGLIIFMLAIYFFRKKEL